MSYGLYRFSGCHVPFVTPFKEDFSLDEDGLRRLINYLIEEEKVDGLVPCGTTGESPTLDHQEHNKVIEITVKEARGKGAGHCRNGFEQHPGGDSDDPARRSGGRRRDLAGGSLL